MIKKYQKKHENGLTLRWVPGHEGITGNEAVDEEAKKAARRESLTPMSKLPACLRNPLPLSAPKLKQVFAAELKHNAGKLWKESPQHNKLSDIDPSMPSNVFTKLTASLPRKNASLLFQLRAQTVPLQRYLWRIGKANDAVCPQCGKEQETVHHFLMTCEAYERQRQRMRVRLGPAARIMRMLLTSADALPHLFQYIHDTKRFHETFGNLVLPKKDSEDEGEGLRKGQRKKRGGRSG